MMVELEWSIPADNGAGIKSIQINCSACTGASSVAIPCAPACPSGRNFHLKADTVGSSVTFQVAALNSVGLGQARTLSVTPSVRPAPVADTRAVAGREAATVMWSAPSNTGGAPLAGFRVHGEPGGISLPLVAATASSGPYKAVVAPLDPDVAYTFNVTAVSLNGLVSEPSLTSVVPFGSGAKSTSPAAPPRHFLEVPLFALEVTHLDRLVHACVLRERPVTLSLGLLSTVVPVVLYIVASIWDWRVKKALGAEAWKSLPLFWAGLAVYHLYVDLHWLIDNTNLLLHEPGYTAQLSPTHLLMVRIGVGLFGGALGVTLILNIVTIHAIMRIADEGDKASSPVNSAPMSMRKWRSKHRWWYAFVYLCSVFKIDFLGVISSGVFHWGALSAPMAAPTADGSEHPRARAIELRKAIPGLIETLPQLAGTLLVGTVNGSWDVFTDTAALVMSIVMLVHGVAVLLDLALCKATTATADHSYTKLPGAADHA